jgi:hypothetical protein
MIRGAQTISSHIGAGLDATVKEVEIPSSTPELAISHKGISEVLEVPMELLLFVTICHTMRIRVNSSIPPSTSTLTHGSDARIPFLDFFDRHQHRVTTNQGGYATGKKTALRVRIVRSALRAIQNGNGEGIFILLRGNRDKRGDWGSKLNGRKAPEKRAQMD